MKDTKKNWMRPILALLLVMSFVLTPFTTVFAADPPSSYNAAYGSAVLDGNKDKAYSNATAIEVNRSQTNKIVGDGRATAKVWTLFDNTALYFYAEVTDDDIINEKDVSIVDRDRQGLNFYFDFLFDQETPYKTGTSWQDGEQGRVETNFVGNEAGNAVLQGDLPGGASTSTTQRYLMSSRGGFQAEVYMVQTSTGYKVELKVTLSTSLQLKLMTTDKPYIGIGFELKDSDTVEQYNGKTSILKSNDNGNVRNEYKTDGTGGSQGFTKMYFQNSELRALANTPFPITVASDIVGGKVTVDKSSACVGETITVTVTPDEGKMLLKGSLKANGQTIKDNTFTMGCEAVSITASFTDYVEPENENEIRVVSQNIKNAASIVDTDHGGVTVSAAVRATRMAILFSEILPDSIGFQEVKGNGRGWAKLLAENFPEYDYVGFGRDYGGSLDTVNEDYANDVCSGEATPIFYLRDKYNLIESGTWWISETPGINPGGSEKPEDTEATWGAEYKMTCTWAVLQNKTTGEMYAHINTHLDPTTDEARTEGMKVVVRKINDLAYIYGSDLPIVITADWNCNQYSDAYQVMISNEEVKVADGAYCLPANEVLNFGPTYHKYGVYKSGTPIDIAFITYENAKVTHYEILTQAVDAGDGSGEGCLSDHYGVYIAFDPTQQTESVREVPPKVEVPEDKMVATYGTAQIDGEIDAVYYNGTPAQLVKDADGYEVDPATTATGTVYYAYDDEYIYFLAQINDSTPVSKLAHVNSYEDSITESVIFMVDYLQTVEGHKAYPVSGEQGIYCVGYSTITGEIMIPKNRQTDIPVEYAVVTTGTGYNVEIKFAMSDQLKAKLNQGEHVIVGVGFQLNDDINDDGIRETPYLTTPTKVRHEYKSLAEGGGSRNFGELILMSNDPNAGPLVEETVPATEPDNNGTQTGDDDNNDDGNGSTKKTLLICVVAVLAVALIGLVVMIILDGKKKAKNEEASDETGEQETPSDDV